MKDELKKLEIALKEKRVSIREYMDLYYAISQKAKK